MAIGHVEDLIAVAGSFGRGSKRCEAEEIRRFQAGQTVGHIEPGSGKEFVSNLFERGMGNLAEDGSGIDKDLGRSG
jgi:hypothetical protein